ncbi:membrane-associated proteins in eicosanoid and glutathione metabolism [Lichtheimia hyalospora FSU 10163]|nr:membrane-associated proteins in eicosanoid and glutathione metabolism [Lichtheimia hyalospora FSU 10163]
MVAIELPHEYGYVLTTFAASAFYLFTLGAQTGKYRRAAGVPYPYAYADKEEAEKDPKKNLFNCAQRVHQNTLEMYPIYSTFLLIGGIKHPVYASVAGVIFLVGRFFFSSGYLTGNPSKRMRGVFSYAALLGLLGMSVSTLYTMLSH